jgi:hypothetical protein
MTDKEYIDKAFDFIVEQLEADPGPVCEVLHQIPEEADVCARDCQNLDHFCLLRFFKYYKKKD